MENVTGARKGSLAYGRGFESYARPADWLDLPEVLEGDQKAVGLFAVYDVPHNYLALVAEGAYTVDWGDGTVENYATGVQAEHDYDYSAIASSTLCSRGYRQVIVTVTPQTGVNLTKLIMTRAHTAQASVPATTAPWLDICVAGEEIATFGAFDTTEWVIEVGALEQFNFIGANKITSCEYMFYDMYSLQNFVGMDTSLVTNFVGMFGYCTALRTIPLLNTSLGTDFTGMFEQNSSLIRIPVIDTSSGTVFKDMFRDCFALREVPVLNLTAGVNFKQMFYRCFSLHTVPDLNMPLGEDFSYMFFNSQSLVSVGVMTTPNGLIFNDMFNSCAAIKRIAGIDTHSATNLTRIIGSITTLVTIPDMDCSGITSASDIAYAIVNNYGQQKGHFVNIAYSVDYSFNFRDRAELVACFEGLLAAVGQTITITGNPGVADLTAADRLIATDKGWTIVE